MGRFNLDEFNRLSLGGLFEVTSSTVISATSSATAAPLVIRQGLSVSISSTSDASIDVYKELDIVSVDSTSGATGILAYGYASIEAESSAISAALSTSIGGDRAFSASSDSISSTPAVHLLEGTPVTLELDSITASSAASCEIIKVYYTTINSTACCEVGRQGTELSWSNIRDGDGTYTYDYSTLYTTLRSQYTTNGWNKLNVIMCSFYVASASLPEDAVLTGAALNIYKVNNANSVGIPYSCVVGASIADPSSNAVASDYQTRGHTLFSDIVQNANTWTSDTWKLFPLNQDGFNTISKDNYSCFAITTLWDVDNTPPPWIYYVTSYVGYNDPTLVIEYQSDITEYESGISELSLLPVSSTSSVVNCDVERICHPYITVLSASHDDLTLIHPSMPGVNVSPPISFTIINDPTAISINWSDGYNQVVTPDPSESYTVIRTFTKNGGPYWFTITATNSYYTEVAASYDSFSVNSEVVLTNYVWGRSPTQDSSFTDLGEFVFNWMFSDRGEDVIGYTDYLVGGSKIIVNRVGSSVESGLITSVYNIINWVHCRIKKVK